MDKEHVIYIYTGEYYLSLKNKEHSNMCHMDEPWINFAQIDSSNKTVTKDV